MVVGFVKSSASWYVPGPGLEEPLTEVLYPKEKPLWSAELDLSNWDLALYYPGPT